MGAGNQFSQRLDATLFWRSATNQIRAAMAKINKDKVLYSVLQEKLEAYNDIYKTVSKSKFLEDCDD